MAAKSTRSKIRWEALQLQHDLERMTARLQKIDTLADDHSEVINEYMPVLVKMFETVHDHVTRFHEQL